MRERSFSDSYSEEEITRDLGGRPAAAAAPVHLADGAPIEVLAAIDQPVVMHDGHRVVWANDAGQTLIGKPVGKVWPGGLVEVACAPVVVDGRARVLCVLAAPPTAAGIDLELLNRTELMALASGGLAHDLGSPMSAMTAHLAALARGLLDLETIDVGHRRAETDAVIERCRGAVLALDEVSEYMARLVRDFGRQVYSAGASGPAPVRRVASQALRIMRSQLANRATVELLGSEDPQAAISPEALSRILINLIANAVDAFGLGQPHLNRIAVSIARTAGGIVLDVVDNAGGIPEAHVPRLFEPFTSARPGRSGVGIGLAVARALARRAGGELMLEESGPGGSRFRLRLRAKP